MNQVVISGRVATDIELHMIKKGKEVANFLLAVPTSFKKDKDGKIPTDFPKVVAWGAKVNLCRNYLAKGRPCIIHGHVTTSKYEHEQTGQIYNKTFITADNIEFLGYRKQFADGTPKEDNEKISEEVGMPELNDMSESYKGLPDDEIPF